MQINTNCVVWGLTAENLAKFTKKGSAVGVSGMLQSRSYEKDGHKVYVTEILVESFDLLEKKDKVLKSFQCLKLWISKMTIYRFRRRKR